MLTNKKPPQMKNNKPHIKAHTHTHTQKHKAKCISMATLPLARWDRRSLLAASGEDRRWTTRWSAGGSGEASNRWDRATASKVGVPWLSVSTLITSDTRPTLKGERGVPQKWDFNVRPTKQKGKDWASTQHSKTRTPPAPQTPDPFWKEKGQGL